MPSWLKSYVIGCASKVFQYPTLVRNEKGYEYIRINNIQLVRGLLGGKSKNKTMKAYIQSKQYHINVDKEGSMRFPKKWY